MSRHRHHAVSRAVNAPKRRFLPWLWGIAGGALMLRLIVSLELAAANGGRNSVNGPSQLSDLATYLRLSKEILEGTFSGEFYYQPFYYAVFLPAIRGVFGYAPAVVFVAQSVLGALTVALTGLAAAQLWSNRAGLIAAVLTAISTPLLLYTPYAQNETLQGFLLTLLFYLALRAFKRPSLRSALAVGVVLGMAILNRGNALLFLPGLVVLLGFQWRRRGVPNGRTAAALLLLVAGTYMVQLPFIIRNTRIRGELTGPSTAADAVLALGNTPEAPAGGRNPGLPAGPMEYPATYSDFMERAAAGRPVPLQMLDFLRREPAAFVELQFRKLLLFWDGREIPNNVSFYGPAEGQSSAVLRLLLPGRSSILLPLVLAGLLTLAGRAWRRRSAGWALLYYLVLTYWGATALFYILSRFRAPILPLALIFGGVFLDQAYRIYRRHGRKALYRGPVPALLAGILIAIPGYDLYRENFEGKIQRWARPAGIVYAMESGETLHLDHGPFTFGGWDGVELKPGAIAVKRFARTAPQAAGRVEFSFAAGPGARCAGRVNEVPFEFTSAKGGIEKVSVETPLPEGVARLEISRVEGEVSLLFDRQREYRRSTFDGAALPGEWVARFIGR
ncbi:MAG: ArnT family glycosyltransferase [Victivallaceae bacterium]